jgi:Zn ribbon nucleic-acid-binding protein
MVRKNSPHGHPPCPVCEMRMLVTDGFKLDRERQTLECLRCGHVDRPGAKIVHKQAAE